MLLHHRVAIVFSWEKEGDLDRLAVAQEADSDLYIPGFYLGIGLKRKANHPMFVSKDAQRDDSENRA